MTTALMRYGRVLQGGRLPEGWSRGVYYGPRTGRMFIVIHIKTGSIRYTALAELPAGAPEQVFYPQGVYVLFVKHEADRFCDYPLGG